MQLSFFKYQGAGNDFVMVDNRQKKLSKNNTNLIKNLCDRKFGIGADGLILLEKPDNEMDDFKMVYFNADGRESSMCGNGGRCIVAFAKQLGIIGEKAAFTAIDGFHEAAVQNELISLKMTDVDRIEQKYDAVFVNTGSPHHINFVDDIASIDIKKQGASIRNSQQYKGIGGTNVNFVENLDEGTFKVRTFERGVEDETLSCGTGVTAVALAVYATGRSKVRTIHLETPGGALSVSFEKDAEGFKNIWLTGPAEMVFKGRIEC
ncbi:MAG: diaminopimelate epimerase [Salinimicrobium sp.]